MPALTFFAVAATAIRGGIGVRAPALSLRATPAVSMGEADASLMELARRRDFQSFVAQARDEPSSVLQLVKDAGVAGAISYTAVELTFFAVALPVGYVAWHASTGEWLQPLLLLRGDDVEGKARLLGLLLSYVVLLKTLFPVRLGSTLLLTPYTQRLLGGLTLPSGRGAAARGSLKAEIRSLAASSRGGVLPFDAAQQQRFDAALAELSALNPTPEPARSPLFSGTWECVWTTESELNFAVDKGLLGLPWRRTYQTIDVPRGALTTPSRPRSPLLD
uniref:Plastid lipid-associated protein/fibrillin conserved domain-containing protein n=1 Tax=Emiliania huxleyi TaxID=2903 RepID=A0A7S3THZ2_EMIHU